MSQRRLFSGGSRQAPDPYDQFLEEKGYYRKHTARDASCLFRVISEQLYDTQLHHEKVRSDCVKFMAKNSVLFQKDIEKPFHLYLEEMSQFKTFGTLRELKALAYRFQRNVLLFEPFNCGSWFVQESDFNNCFFVFFTPEKHFDSIFDNYYIEDLAFAQGLCYEVLYCEVFNLPDIMYATERMLHFPVESSMRLIKKYTGKNKYEEAFITDEGREFILSRADNTSCILDNYELCHFHNKDFALFASNIQTEVDLCRNMSDRYRLNRKLESLLPDKQLSCVRQLLNEGITPFPYKVAKGLDPDIYRNIEFDAWSDYRKIKRFNNANCSPLQIGHKCHVRLKSSDSSLYNGHIQEIRPDLGCLVYIEELGEKMMVPAGRVLCSDKQFKYENSYRYRKYSPNIKKYNNDVPRRTCRKMRCLSNGNEARYRGGYLYGNDMSDRYMTLNDFNSMRNFAPPPYELIAMPMVRDSPSKKNLSSRNDHLKNCNEKANRNNSERADHQKDNENDMHSDLYSNGESPLSFYDQNLPFPYDPNIPPPPPQNSSFAAHHTLCNNVYNYPAYQPTSPPINSMFPASPNAIYNPMPYVGNMQYYSGHMGYPFTIPIKRRDLLQTQFPVNLHIQPSVMSNGQDIPTNDLISVRFFYNLGHEYFKYIHTHYGMQGVNSLTQIEMSQVQPNEHIGLLNDCPEVKKLSNDLQMNLRIENEIPATAKLESAVIPPKGYNRNQTSSSTHTHSNKKESKHNYHRNIQHTPTKSNRVHSLKKDPKDVKEQAKQQTTSLSMQYHQPLADASYISPTSIERSEESIEYYEYPMQPYQFYSTYVPYNQIEGEGVTYYTQNPYYSVPPYQMPQNISQMPEQICYENSPIVEQNGGSFQYATYPPTIIYQQPIPYSTRPQGAQYWLAPHPTYVPIQPPNITSQQNGFNNSTNSNNISQ